MVKGETHGARRSYQHQMVLWGQTDPPHTTSDLSVRWMGKTNTKNLGLIFKTILRSTNFL